MTSEVIVALLSVGGTLIGSLLGIIASSKLIVYRLEQLEKKVEKHNNVIERVTSLEYSKKMVENRLDILEEFKSLLEKEEFSHE
jgi:hypothetical protein